MENGIIWMYTDDYNDYLFTNYIEMREVMQNAISLLIQHANEDFVSKKEALKAASDLELVMNKFDQWHWIEHALTALSVAERKHCEWPTDIVYAFSILGEEYGEAQKEVVKLGMNEPGKSLPNLKKEVIQTMAMCLRFLKNMDGYDLRPKSRTMI